MALLQLQIASVETLVFLDAPAAALLVCPQGPPAIGLSEACRLSSSLFRQPNTNPGDLVVCDEQHAGFFERALNSHHGRNVSGDWAAAFFNTADSGRAYTRGL